MSASRNRMSIGSVCCFTVSWASPSMTVINPSTPAFTKFSRAILTRSGSISCVQSLPPVVRRASPNQMAE